MNVTSQRSIDWSGSVSVPARRRETALGSATVLIACLMACTAGEYARETTDVVEVPDARLQYVTVGRGPPLIVVPGGPGFGHHYLRGPLTEQLSQHRRLTFYDPRGTGSSSGQEITGGFTMETFVADLDAVRSAIDAETVDLLGHSFGGLLVLHYVLRHPGRVRSVVLVDGDPATYAEWSVFRTVVDSRRTEAEWRTLREIESEQGWSRRPDRLDEYFRTFLRPYFGRDSSAKLDFAFDSASYRKLTATARAVRADLGEWDLMEALPSIDVPVLLVYGGRSVFRPEAAQAMHAALPASRLEIIPDVGHFPFLEDPEVFGSIVRRFFETPIAEGSESSQ